MAILELFHPEKKSPLCETVIRGTGADSLDILFSALNLFQYFASFIKNLT